MTYKIKFRRRLWHLWTTITVAGHSVDQESDRITFYFADGSILEVPDWSDHYCRLGVDWVLAVKKTLEAKAGQAVPLSI